MSPSTELLEKRPRPPSHVIAPEDGPDWRPPVGKSVMWKPNNVGLEKSKKILDALFFVRRAGKETDEADAEAAAEEKPKKKSADPMEDAPLFKATLMDLRDTSSSLMKVAAQLKDGSDPVHDVGGGRHPSAVIAMRTLMVVQRKMALVRAIEQRFLAFEAAHNKRQAIFKDISAGVSSGPPELSGIASFIKKHVHHGGEPVDADKSDFKAFAKSFGLPAKHHIIVKLERLANEACDWWTAETLDRARHKANADELKRLLAVVTGIQAKSVHKAGVEEISVALGDRLAEQVLSVAQSLQKKDAFAVSRSDVPQVESAAKCAAEINENIKEAVAMGAPTTHPCLDQAKSIAVSLEVEAKARIAQKALIHAKLQQARDENLQEAAGPEGLVEVGPASGFADSIEDAIKKAIKEGAPRDHEYLAEATEIAKTLRTADVDRRRLCARAERLKKEAGGKPQPKNKKKGKAKS